MTPRTVQRDPLGSFWYFDGVLVERCKVCLERKDAPHRPECQLGQVIAAVQAMSDSDGILGSPDIEHLITLQRLLDVHCTETR